MSDRTESNVRRNATFDDRIDTVTRIDFRQAIGIMLGAFRLLGTEQKLFVAKVCLSLLSVIPGLYITWLSKIFVDQVLLQQPFSDSAVRMPPHVQPIIDALSSSSPLGILSALIAIYVFLLFVWGFGRGSWQQVAQGEDSATQAENALNQGGSESSGIIGFLDSMVQVRLSQRLSNQLRTNAFDRMAQLPMTTLDDHRIGDAIYRVMYDAPMVPGLSYQLSLEPLFLLIGAAIQLWFVFFSYGNAAPELVWLALLLIPIGLLVTVPFSSITRRVQQNSRASGTATTNAMEESLGNIAAVQSLGTMRRERDRFAEQSKESFRRFRITKIISIIVNFSVQAGYQLLTLAIAIWISNDIITSVLSPGDWAVLLAIWGQLGGTTVALSRFWIDMQANVAAVRRVNVFVEMEVEQRSDIHQAEFQESISLENVSFAYPGGRRALESVDLLFKKGEVIAIVGPTGAGKTTLAYLLPAFVRPTSGRVLFDGQDIADVDVESIREKVAFVFQEHMLLSESIRSNLSLVNPRATEDEMRDALRLAGALEFVDALPHGLDTILGRSGDTLSVGQKQRLCIARGLIRNTPVLILDEPTAALDPKTEQALVESLQSIRKDKLVVIIAHRLSTIQEADRIVFLEEGRVRDVGSHEDLVASLDSPYRDFVELQTRLSQ